MDRILIKNLRVKGHLGASHWQLDEGQMLIFNIIGYLQFQPTDNINDTVSYFTISEHIQQFLEEERKCKTLERLADIVALDCLELGLKSVQVQIEKSHALLHADTVGIRIERNQADIGYLKAITAMEKNIPQPYPNTEDVIFIKDLQINCIIGVNTFERIEKQRIILNIDVYFPPTPIYSTGRIPPRHNYRTIAQRVTKFVEQSNYKTIEMMANDVANVVMYQCNVYKVTVKIEKPSALMFADTAGVEVTRKIPDFHDVVKNLPDSCTVYLAIGTNMGDRVKNIESAIDRLSSYGIDLLDTSFLYETAPMYVLEQPKFLNACLKVRWTHLGSYFLETSGATGCIESY
jgi:dihydroneopterin aldolase/2-amino-4-hydroxy-6-hydroxymethyldihydropteridine diphosphokinase/dihydropteroate synthase/2-amino-4-hydroxy-6-hydroxymethyldihydropteridine diphosphokinase/dihydropteroate synthase